MTTTSVLVAAAEKMPDGDTVFIEDAIAWSPAQHVNKSCVVYREGKTVSKHASMKSLETADLFGVGPFNTICADYITGDSYLKPLTNRETDSVFVVNVTFAPGSRNRWHIHHAAKGGGHVLLCTAGEGWYQIEGENPIELLPGMVIVVPANVKHWHGAKADSWFSHVAVDMPGEETRNEWLEPVTEEEYSRL